MPKKKKSVADLEALLKELEDQKKEAKKQLKEKQKEENAKYANAVMDAIAEWVATWPEADRIQKSEYAAYFKAEAKKNREASKEE